MTLFMNSSLKGSREEAKVINSRFADLCFNIWLFASSSYKLRNLYSLLKSINSLESAIALQQMFANRLFSKQVYKLCCLLLLDSAVYKHFWFVCVCL